MDTKEILKRQESKISANFAVIIFNFTICIFTTIFMESLIRLQSKTLIILLVALLVSDYIVWIFTYKKLNSTCLD